MAFSQTLKRLRKERFFSQKDIANYLGITRQAIASYELGKREPDYEILKKLADYFNISVDYLLGRETCKDINALTIGRNIDLIRENFTYKEFSEDIGRKIGVVILPEMLELCARGERMPFIGTIKILAKYASVHESFFYSYNTYEAYIKEKQAYIKETLQNDLDGDSKYVTTVLSFSDNELANWLGKEDSLQYVKLAKEIQEAGLKVDVLKPLLNSIKGFNL